MKQKKNWLAWALVGAISAGVSILYTYFSKPQIAYFELNKVYQQFEFRKELESKLSLIDNSGQKILDSLGQKLQNLSAVLQASPSKNPVLIDQYYSMREEFASKKLELSEMHEMNLTGFNEQIWNQINRYVQQYGKEKGYCYLHGADGSGGLMYASDSDNITEELVVYINQKYKGL